MNLAISSLQGVGSPTGTRVLPNKHVFKSSHNIISVLKVHSYTT